MPEYVWKTNFTSQQWQSAYKSLDIHKRSLLTAWEQGQAFKKAGFEIFRLGIYENQKPKALILVINTPAKRGRFLKVFVNFSDDSPPEALFRSLIERLKSLASETSAIFINLASCLMNTANNVDLMTKFKLRLSLINLTTPSTLKLDLTDLSEESLFRGKRYAKLRYEIRQAEDNNLSVTVDNSLSGIESFLKIHQLTQHRQKFVQEPLSFIKIQALEFFKANKLHLYLVHEEDNSEALASAVMIDLEGERSYLYGGSSTRGQTVGASYLLQKQAISDALKQGLSVYNLWGVAPPKATSKHNFYGLTIFKSKFTRTRYDYLPTYTLSIKKLHYLFFWILTRLEKNTLLRHLLFKFRH
ncbi:MAG: peptidoglycan bridge formation glycyltransferase FemA/FemB family protein [Candidatus Saccharibacteria bacterium]|nr:peptidoglycan bridge formation glycyltransferase FemA/FemB family protein [Candidatus Saccharibacteria bacterium]